MTGSSDSLPSPQISDPRQNDGVASSGPNPLNLAGLFVPLKLVQATVTPPPVLATTRVNKDWYFRLLDFKIGEGDLQSYHNCLPVSLFSFQSQGEMSDTSYYVRPGTDAFSQLAQDDRLRSAVLVLGQTQHRVIFVWELRLPEGRNASADRWAVSRLRVAESAIKNWVKIVADKSTQGYIERKAEGVLHEPDWSGLSLPEYVSRFASEKVIDSLAHPVMQDYLGR